MIHIFLVILKMIGILLAVLLGILLFLALSLLFWPLRYKLWVHHGESWKAKGTVRFWGPVIWLSFHYEDGIRISLRVCGIPVWRRIHNIQDEEVKEGSQGKKKKALDAGSNKERETGSLERVTISDTMSAEEAGQEKTEEKTDLAAREPESHSDANRQENREEYGKKSFGKSGKDFWNKWKKIRMAIKHFFQSIRNILELREDERVRAGLSKCKSELFYLLKKIKPRSIKGYFEFGFEDPSVTGKVLAVVAIVKSMWNTSLAVQPDFEHKLFRADLTVKGKVQGFRFVRTGWKMIFDKDITYMIEKGKEIRRN